MLRHHKHLILLFPLLLVSLLSHSQQRSRDTLILHFPLDSYRIQPDDSARLRAMLGSLSANPVSITGYTDKTGTIAYNARLSQLRANAAYRFIHHGRAAGGGVAPTPERSDSENRRVEIVYYRIINAPHYDTVARNNINPNTPTDRADSIVVIKHSPADTTTADSARPSAVLALRRINFIVDTPIPTDSTRRILPQFITELRQFKDHRLEIDGYVNSIVPLHGTNDPLFKLSVNRAKFIYDCLVTAGFDPSLLTYKGMGNASPVNPHPQTKQEMNANMRVEIRVY
ncbi:MAG TPA: OmpA family protein [Puia sp.]|nr:OmpA family protein [Puia sp.]